MQNDIQTIDFHIKELDSMKVYPEYLYYKGNTSLLQKTKISIVGSRKPNSYAKQLIHQISSRLSSLDICIVSGGAMGIDTIAHKAATSSNTIMVAGTGLDIRYPAINKKMIQDIESNGLLLSQFEAGVPSQRYNFPLRNELVVALGDILIVAYADENSGTMRSVKYALKMGKEIYVLPHRIGESTATNKLLQEGKAKAIYDIDEFLSMFDISDIKEKQNDEVLDYFSTNPLYDNAMQKYSSEIFEYELSGKISIKDGIVYVV